MSAEKPKGGLARRPSVDAQLSAKLPGGGSAGKIDTSPPPTTTTTTEPGPAAATRFTNDLPANVTVAPTRLAGNYADLPMPPQKAMSVEDAAAAGGVVPLQDASNLLIASRQPSNATLQSKGSSRDSIFSQLMSSVSGFFGGGGGGGGSSSHVNRENSLDGLPRLASDPQMLLKSQLSSAEGIHLTEVEGAVATTGGAATADVDDGYGGMLTGTDEDLTSIIDLAQLEEIVREADGEEQLDPSYGPNYTDTAVTDMAHLLQSGGSSMDVLRVELDLPSPSDLQKGPQKKGRGKKKDQPAAVPAAGLAGLASSFATSALSATTAPFDLLPSSWSLGLSSRTIEVTGASSSEGQESPLACRSPPMPPTSAVIKGVPREGGTLRSLR